MILFKNAKNGFYLDSDNIPCLVIGDNLIDLEHERVYSNTFSLIDVELTPIETFIDPIEIQIGKIVYSIEKTRF